MIVVDASAWVDHFLHALPTAATERLTTDDLVGPAHVDFEVGSALLRRERKGQLGQHTAQELMTEFTSMPFDRIREPVDLVAAYGLLNNASYADALYLALAQRLASPVMTSDAGMIESARVGGIKVIDATT